MTANTMLTFSRAVTSQADMIFIIDCLRSEDMQHGRRREELILDELMRTNINKEPDIREYVRHERCSSLRELIDYFMYVIKVCRAGFTPLIFIDGHGDPEKGLELPSGEFLSWRLLVDIFTAIIALTKGHLTVVAAFCHSFCLVEHINRYGLLPYSFYYGYKSEVGAGVVADETALITTSLIRDGGKDLMHSSPNISLHSEYDHIADHIAPSALLIKAPKVLASVSPLLSTRSIRRSIEVDAAKRGVPLRDFGKNFKRVVKSPALTKDLIMQFMHDTPRRERLLAEILPQLIAPSS